MIIQGVHSDRIHIRVSLAVLLIDDFTDQVIPVNQATVRISGEKRPIVKNDGFYIFTDIEKRSIVMEVTSFRYQKRIVPYEFCEKEAGTQCIRLRMVPNDHYKLPEQTTFLCGRMKPGEVMDLVFRSHANPLHLLEDYDCNGGQIKLYNPTEMVLEERQVLLMAKEDYEVTQIVRALPSVNGNKDIYEISGKLKHRFTKSETSIFVIHRIIGDEEGNFNVPLPGIVNKGETVLCERIKKGKINKHFELKYGCKNDIIL